MTLYKAIREYDDIQLLRCLQDGIKNNKKRFQQDVLMQTMKWKQPDHHQYKDYTSLQLVFHHNRSKEVILKMIDIGGKQLVMKTNHNGETALHTAAENENVSVDTISKLIKVGGRELLKMKNQDGDTPLHCACKNENVSIDIVSKLIKVGGRELLMMKNHDGDTALHWAYKNKNVSLDIVLKFIKMGGRELLKMKNQDGDTALHSAYKNKNASVDKVLKLIEAGGRKLVMMKNRHGYTALHSIFWGEENISGDIVSKLIKVAGRELLMNEIYVGLLNDHFSSRNGNFNASFDESLFGDDGDFVESYFGSNDKENSNNSIAFLVKEFILSNIGGEFGIGGLFNVARQKIQDKIYQKWKTLSPALKSAIKSLQEEHSQQPPPILHAAIITKAPLHVIQDIITQFEYSVLQTDSLNRYPLVVALEEGLCWNKGLKQVVEATVVAQQKDKSIYTAAQIGLKWRYQYMKELAEANADEIYNGYDSSTGLRVFMVAAMGGHHDLSGIYGMMRMSPETRNTV